MRASQWFIFGIAFMVLTTILTNISLQASIPCGFNFESNAIACIRAQAFAPFPYIFFFLGTASFISGAIELWSKKK
ncbi:MAG: hypothetical protein IIA87_02695 [Nanoarchaeota archaeon]|nr:hypothetical protein [Nanoarchaeota archaeon]